MAKHQLELSVRDYEMDIQGVVNNAVYQNYLEHARHQVLKAHGLDFVDYAERGINLVMIRAEIDYKVSLKGGDNFVVATEMKKKGRVRFEFDQTITNQNGELCLNAKITCVALNEKGKPYLPKEIAAILDVK